MKGVFAFGLASLLVVVLAETVDKPVVDTHYGKLEGKVSESRGGRTFYKFKGIPYAKAPERFQAPETPDNWEGIKSATEFGGKCAQYSYFLKENLGGDDCLYLNVYTPKLNKEGDHKVLLPVMVWIHPGAFIFGSGELFSPKYFMDEEVILVTINYRLGPFGFLNTGDENAQGNMGLKDQVAALKWVKENIENFSGDKNRVTIFGSDSGATSVMTHLISPLSKGLFQNAIAQSGSPSGPWTFIADPINQAKKLGEQVGCPTDTTSNLVTCLKGKDTKYIIDMMPKLTPTQFNAEDIPKFALTIETPLKGQTENDIFLSDTPFRLLKEGKVQSKVPLIIGANDHDGLTLPTVAVLNSTDAMARLNKEWKDLAPKLFVFEKTAKDKEALAQKIRDFYFEDKEVSSETGEQLQAALGDRFFFSPIRGAGKLYSKHAPTYMYYLARQPEYSALDYFDVADKKSGVAHYDEIQYLFPKTYEKKDYAGNDAFPEITKDSKDFTFSQELVKLWTSFAETGKPSRTWGEGKEWKKTDFNEKPKWYELNDETKVLDEANPTPMVEKHIKRMDFWHKIYNEDLTELDKPTKETF